jgi:hypothetical protein
VQNKMVDKSTIQKIISSIWVIILVILWVLYPFLPGDIFFWMWIAMNWSILGCIIGAMLFTENKKYEIIIGVIWVVLLVLLWIFYPIFGGDTQVWMWTVITWSIIGNILYIGLFLLK